MPSIDWGYEQLVNYRPSLTREPDFAAFWAETLAQTRAFDLDPQLDPQPYPMADVGVQRLTFAGFGGHRIGGLYLTPRTIAEKPAPVVIVYHGYTGGAGQVHQHLAWVMMGCAVISVDPRGQGGETGEAGGYRGGSVMGWMTNGILDPQDYYYRRVYADCVRAVDFAFTRPELDCSRLCVAGGSQGGGLSIAAAGLEPRIKLCAPDVPFLCHFRRAVEIAGAGPFPEISNYLGRYPQHVETVWRTLSYHDGMNLAAAIPASTRMLWSVGLWDDVCPPSTVYAAYNHAPSPEGAKQMAVYPFNKHEGGGGWQAERKIAWLAEELARPLE
jgi:cephalosporin-C deacetylase